MGTAVVIANTYAVTPLLTPWHTSDRLGHGRLDLIHPRNILLGVKFLEHRLAYLFSVYARWLRSGLPHGLASNLRWQGKRCPSSSRKKSAAQVSVVA